MKTHHFALSFAFCSLVSCQTPMAVNLPDKPAKANHFPAIQVQNLNHAVAKFPEQFPGKRTLLIVAFDGKQQSVIDEWVQHFPRKDASGTEWLEMPVIPDSGFLARWFISTGMRSGMPEPIVRNRVFTLYTQPENFVKALGLPDSKQVHVAVADRSGKILAHVSGEWTEAKDKAVRAALE